MVEDVASGPMPPWIRRKTYNYEIWEDFEEASLSASKIANGQSNGTFSQNATANTPQSSHVWMYIQSAANANAWLSTAPNVGYSGTPVEFRCAFGTVSIPSHGTDTRRVFIGFSDNSGIPSSVSNGGFYYDESASPNWLCYARSVAGGVVTVNTGVAAASWAGEMAVLIDAASGINFLLNGTSVGSINSITISATQYLSVDQRALVRIERGASGTNLTQLRLDWLYYRRSN